jgi:hypothetical protein
VELRKAHVYTTHEVHLSLASALQTACALACTKKRGMAYPFVLSESGLGALGNSVLMPV